MRTLVSSSYAILAAMTLLSSAYSSGERAREPKPSSLRADLRSAIREDLVDDLTVGRDSACPIHEERMEKRKVPIRYGSRETEIERVKMIEIAGSHESLVALEKNMFPFARTSVTYSDEIHDPAPAWALCFVCQHCLAALDSWKKMNTGEPGATDNPDGAQ